MVADRFGIQALVRAIMDLDVSRSAGPWAVYKKKTRGKTFVFFCFQWVFSVLRTDSFDIFYGKLLRFFLFQWVFTLLDVCFLNVFFFL